MNENITYVLQNTVTLDDVNIGSPGHGGALKTQEYIKDKNRILEYGAGTSTLYFSKMVNHYVSIEHDASWYNDLKSRVDNNVELYHVPVHIGKIDDELDKHAADLLSRAGDTELRNEVTHWNTRGGYDWHEGIDYIKKPLGLDYRNYDVVIVDGRCRVFCAYIAQYLIKDGGYLIFDDFNTRTYYHGILKYYEVVDGSDTLAVLLKRKKEISNDEVIRLSEKLYSDFKIKTGRIR